MGIRKAAKLGNIVAPLKQGAGRVLDTALPPHSLISGLPLTPDEAELWQSLEFLDDPCCDACGFPFEYDQGEGTLCARCHARPPRYDRGRSAITYDEHSKKIVLDFKHGGRTDGLSFFASQMQRAGRPLLENADFIVPVPLHNARLRSRRFNQSALLARSLSKNTDIPYYTELLLRRKNTPSQGSQTYLGRKRNVASAFHIPARSKARIKGANILLIDDVLTTGATLEACAMTLKRGGAAQVDALTLMRVVRPASLPT